MLNHFSIFKLLPLFYKGKGKVWNISCGNKRSHNSYREHGGVADLFKAVILNYIRVLSTDPAILLNSTSHCKNQHSETQIIHIFPFSAAQDFIFLTLFWLFFITSYNVLQFYTRSELCHQSFPAGQFLPCSTCSRAPHFPSSQPPHVSQ